MNKTNDALLSRIREREALGIKHRERTNEFREKIVNALNDMGFTLSAVEVEGPTRVGRDRLGNPPYCKQLTITIASCPYEDGEPAGWPL